MSRITQRFAASFTIFFAALGVVAALPIASAQPVIASNLSAPAADHPNGLARGVLDAAPSLARALPPGRNAAPLANQYFTEALKSAPERLAQLPDRPFWVDGTSPRLRGVLVAQTERLDIYVGIETFPEEQIAELAPHLEQILRDNEAWYGTRLTNRVSLGFYRPAAAEIEGARGMAYTDQARAEVYFAEGENLDRALVVAAHELAHHLEEQRFGTAVQKRADTILHEGLATWITGRRWMEMCGASSWKQRARQIRDAGIPLRLLTAEDYGANKAYELWASFTDYLIRQYGWDAYDTLYASGSSRYPGSADYKGVLGKPLDELADEWRGWVNE